MRNTTFRGITENYHKLVFGFLAKTTDTNGNNHFTITSENNDTHCVVEQSIGQTTGAKDRNGNTIFEGDIIKNIYGQLFSISYSNQSACFIAQPMTSSLLSEKPLHELKTKTHTEIVGNIFQYSQDTQTHGLF